jgi:hypothetical protein
LCLIPLEIFRRQLVKLKIFIAVVLLFINVSGGYSEENSAHYVDVHNNPLPQYEWIYNELVKCFGDCVPQKITIKYSTGITSRFNPCSDSIIISKFSLEQNKLIEVIGHESCHLGLAHYTGRASILEKHRFFDEGFAEIFESIIGKRAEEYKCRALAYAAEQNYKNNVSFAKVQKWSVYFGNPRQKKANFGAYLVGASFDFFIIDTFGTEHLLALFRDIGQTRDLEQSFKNIFAKNKKIMEAEWLRYLSEITVNFAQKT